MTLKWLLLASTDTWSAFARMMQCPTLLLRLPDRMASASSPSVTRIAIISSHHPATTACRKWHSMVASLTRRVTSHGNPSHSNHRTPPMQSNCQDKPQGGEGNRQVTASKDVQAVEA